MKRIILVEDDPDDVYLFENTLSAVNNNFDLTVLESGEALLDFFHNAKIQEDMLVLLDLNLPKMSGLDVLEVLKKENQVNRNIIVVFSTSKYEKDIDDAYELGAKSYISKTTDPKGLREIVKTLDQYWFDKAQLPRKKTNE